MSAWSGSGVRSYALRAASQRVPRASLTTACASSSLFAKWKCSAPVLMLARALMSESLAEA